LLLFLFNSMFLLFFRLSLAFNFEVSLVVWVSDCSFLLFDYLKDYSFLCFVQRSLYILKKCWNSQISQVQSWIVVKQ